MVYATNPERALTLLDSALLLGNVSDYRAQFIRAKIFSKSLEEQQLDSAISICQLLLTHDSVRNDAREQENIYDMLIAAEVGFTPANLREQFKRKYGITPVEYRKNQ